MVDIDGIRRSLYTRQQIAVLTGIDDSTLNYWMREGVLVSSTGGGGKGQHRRFAYHQINLALLLDQLRGFGVGLPGLKRLAERFHQAVAFMDHLGVTRDNEEWLSTLIKMRREVEANGFISESVFDDHLERTLKACPWLVNREMIRQYRHSNYQEFKVSFDEAVDLRRNGLLIYGREAEDGEDLPEELIALSAKIDPAAYRNASKYWTHITYIGLAPAGESFSPSPEILYRDASGEWTMDVDPGNLPGSAISFVGVDLDQLTYRAWHAA